MAREVFDSLVLPTLRDTSTFFASVKEARSDVSYQTARANSDIKMVASLLVRFGCDNIVPPLTQLLEANTLGLNNNILCVNLAFLV